MLLFLAKLQRSKINSDIVILVRLYLKLEPSSLNLTLDIFTTVVGTVVQTMYRNMQYQILFQCLYCGKSVTGTKYMYTYKVFVLTFS